MVTFITITLVTLFTSLVKLTQQSIAGVTYMDNFDFEQRYRNTNECNPLYWHPLHLPSKCARFYEKLIRSRLSPYQYLSVLSDPFNWSNDDSDGDYDGNDGVVDDDGGDDSDNGDLISYEPKFYFSTYRRDRAPFEVMLDALRKDVQNEPSIPRIEIMPNLGVAAVYHQPISRKSEDIIKQVALDYGKAGAEAYVQAGLFTQTTTETNMHTASGVYHDGVENGPSRTHYKFKFYPGMGKNGGEKSMSKFVSEPKVKTYVSKNNKRVKKKKIVDGNTVYYIRESKKI